MTLRHPRTQRRTLVGLGSVVALVAGMLVAVAAPAVATVPAGEFTRPFASVFDDTVNGDITSRGNTVMTCETGTFGWKSSGTGPACVDVQAGTAAGQNNYFNMVYVDVDSDADTFNSSSATITIPDGATVLYAGLTWAGITSAGKYVPTTGPNPGVPVLVGAAAPDRESRGTVKLEVPSSGSYSTITSTQTDTTGSKYQAYADVTDEVLAAGSGQYTVANIQAGTGGNVYAGWSLTVAYQLASLPQRNLVVYTGYGQVDPSGSDLVTVDAPLSGFVTPASGVVVSRLGIVAFDGDRDVKKEALRLGETTISNGLNPADDVFNSSITDLNVTVSDGVPSTVNLFGVDIDTYQTSGALAAETSSTVAHFDTTGDGYYPGVITLATNLAPTLMTVVKSVTDVNGDDLERGDVLAYSVAVTNSGTDGAVAVTLADAIPAGTTYVPGSLQIDSSTVSDNADSDSGEVVGGNVTARLGSGATGVLGGTLAVSGSATVTFQVTVDESLTESTVISNTASISYNDLTGGAAHTVGSNPVSSSLYVPPVLTFNPTVTRGEVDLAYSKALSHTGGTAPFTWSLSSGALPAGLTLDAATGVIAGTPTAAGEAVFTVKITDSVSQSDEQAATLTIVQQPVIKSGTSLAEGVVGTSYSNQLTKSGGISPFTWSVSAGALPAGLTMDTAGLITGTPTAGGVASFTVQLEDGRDVVTTKAFTLKILFASTTSLTSSVATVEFGTTVTLTATVTPSDATGKVNFTVVPTTGPQTGQTVQLGTNVLTGGVATKTVTLPAFGDNPIVAAYEGNTGNRTWAGSDSAPASVEVTGYPGQLIVTQFRSSGPDGADDSYIQLFNTGKPLPLGGFVISTTSGTDTTLPAEAGTLATGQSFLLAGSDYSLGSQAAADLTVETLGSGGIKVLAPDTAGTQTDAVGPESGFHTGTPLPTMTGTPTDQYAWVRLQSAGTPVNTGDNLADFHLVSSTGGTVGEVESSLGAPAPTSTSAPTQRNATLQSTLLDSGANYRLEPNRAYTAGSPGTLIIRRTITNSSSDYINVAKLRITSISQVGGAPQPGAVTQPTTVAHLRVVDPATATSEITTTGGPVTVQNLSLDTPAGVPGGGLNSTMTIPLPDGGLPPGGTVSFAVTLAVDSTGTFWFGYDIDATIMPG